MTRCDVAIIGAGPYGLSATAHLRSVKGLDVHTFGEPMSFWEDKMPVGMLLRSGWAATHIADPNQSLTLEAFRSVSRIHFSSPVPLDRFVDYGHWYQQQAVPDLDRRKIVRVKSDEEKVKLDKFYFGGPNNQAVLDDKAIAARIQDGFDDEKVTVRAWWTKPWERPHQLAGTMSGRVPPLYR